MLRSIHSRRSPASASRSLLVAVLSSLLVVVLSSLLAPASARAGQAEEAKLHFDKAQLAYQLGKYEEAIGEYEVAYRTLPEPAFLFNMAQAHRLQYALDKKPAHLHQALSLYKGYLRELPQAANRATVLKLVEELKALLTAVEEEARAAAKPGHLVLKGANAAGASATLDGKVLGTLPLAATVPPGAHQLRVTRPGYLVWSSSLTVASGSQLEVPVVLQPLASPSKPAPAPAAPAPRPFYKKWWFWTIAGAVLVAGVGTGTYFGVRGERVAELPQVDMR